MNKVRKLMEINFDIVYATFNDIAMLHGKIALPFDIEDINNIIREYYYSHIQVVRYNLDTPSIKGIIKDIVYVNEVIIAELVSTVPHFSLVIHPVDVDWKEIGYVLSHSITLWDKTMIVSPLKCKASIPIPHQLLHYGNDYKDININVKWKMFLYINSVDNVEEAMQIYNNDPNTYFED